MINNNSPDSQLSSPSSRLPCLPQFLVPHSSFLNPLPLSGLPLEELTALLSPLPHYRAVQVFKWIASGADSFDVMNNLPLQLRKELSEQYALRPDNTVREQRGSDGTVKLAMQFPGDAVVEAVLLNDGSQRHTACLSTQAGCPAACVFCRTGAYFVRDLDSAEIVEQFLRLMAIAAQITPNETADNSQLKQRGLPISNIVVMGMGEPLLNLRELRRAIAVISGKEGMHFSHRRFTVSTCGIADGIADLADNGPAVRLALSLTTADENLRRRLMPITAREPLHRVKESLCHFQNCGGGRLTLEAVLLGGINTRDADAQSIANFAKGLDVVVNLIPWNPVDGLGFEGKPLRQPSADEVESFSRRLNSLGMKVTLRYRKGRGIMGACGQLGNNLNSL